MASKRIPHTEAGHGTPIKRSAFKKVALRVRHAFVRNRGLLTNPAFLRLLPKLIFGRLYPSTLARRDTVMFVGTHHKSMTTYFSVVLRLLGMGLGLRYQTVNLEEPDSRTQLFLSAHSRTDFDRLRPYRGVHIMRDPRDMIISGYHYHKWTSEEWVHRPDENGRTYQQKLLEASQDDGLFMEIDHFVFFYRDLLESWDLEDPDILEVAYTDLMGPQKEELYRKIYEHLGFAGSDLDFALRLMRLFQADSRMGKDVASKPTEKSHVRSGSSGQWKGMLTQDHLDYIEEQLGPVLRKFGY